MGVSTNFYTIYGIKIEWDDDFYNAYDEVYDDPDTPFVLVESMCGDYIILGEVLFDSGDMRWGFEGGDQYKEYDDDELLQKVIDYKQAFCEKFPGYSHLIAKPFKIISLMHFS